MSELTIIERLRYEECDGECIQPCYIHKKVREDAAAEIERLAARLAEAERLLAAARPYVNQWECDGKFSMAKDQPGTLAAIDAFLRASDSALPVLRSMVTVAAPPYLCKDCGVTITEVCNHYCWEQPDSADADPTLPPPASP